MINQFEVKILETDEEFKELIPLIIEFCKKTNLSLTQSFYEVTHGFTIIAKKEGKIEAYLNGNFLTKTEFFGCQALSKDSDVNFDTLRFFEDKLIEMGCKRISMQTHLSPEVFEKYGFKFERYLLFKEIA